MGDTEGVQRAIGKPSGSCYFYQYDKEINFGSLKKQTIYLLQGDFASAEVTKGQ